MATHNMTTTEVMEMLQNDVDPILVRVESGEIASPAIYKAQEKGLDELEADLSRTQQNIKAIDEQTNGKEAPTPSRAG